MQREASGALFSYFNTGDEQSAKRDPKSGAAKKGPPTIALAGQARSAGDGPKAAMMEGAPDPAAQDKIWRQFLVSQQKLDKQWDENWGFLTDYDPKGNIKTKKALPEEATVYSDKIPNTDSGNYGNRLATNTGQRIAQMQAQFEAQNRRTKSDKDIICY